MSGYNETCVVGERVPRLPIPVEYTKVTNRIIPIVVYPDWEVALKVCFYILAIILDIGGNSIVIAIIVLNRKMRTTTNVLILNLAVSDLMVGIFCMWVHMGNQITTDWVFGAFMCKFTNFTQVLSVNSSVLTLTVISLERFIAVVYPFKGHWSPLTTGAIIVVTWLVSIAMAAPNLFTRTHVVIPWKDSTQIYCADEWPLYIKDKDCETWAPGQIIYYSIQGIVMYFLPIGVMIVAYSLIVYTLIIRKAPGSHVSSAAVAQEKTKRKVTTMLIVVLLVFIVCWTPQNTFLLWDLFKEEGEYPDYVSSLRYFALFIAYFNSALNPILYCGFNDNFRKGFLEAFKCFLIKKRNKIGPDSIAPKSFMRTAGRRNQQETTYQGGNQGANAKPGHFSKTVESVLPNPKDKDLRPNPPDPSLHPNGSVFQNQPNGFTSSEKEKLKVGDNSLNALTKDSSQGEQNSNVFQTMTIQEEPKTTSSEKETVGDNYILTKDSSQKEQNTNIFQTMTIQEEPITISNEKEKLTGEDNSSYALTNDSSHEIQNTDFFQTTIVEEKPTEFSKENLQCLSDESIKIENLNAESNC